MMPSMIAFGPEEDGTISIDSNTAATRKSYESSYGSRFERYSVAVTDFAGGEDRSVYAGLLPMLLHDALEHRGAGFGGVRIERDHHAAQVHFGDRDPGFGSDADRPPDPVELFEGLAAGEI